ncbi:MAG: hypothetical protein FWD24_06875, partial [Treponema sp.]|nr:hypothetical protein [Treponema sp.]
NNLPPVNSLITVTVRGIENTNGEPMNGTYTFSWLTPVTAAASGEINSWETSYDFNTNSITVNWNTTGADRVVTYYRINKGSYIQLTSGTASTGTISGVPRIDNSRILQGIKTNNVYEYEIFIELYKENIREDFVIFRIWNIEGMTVNQTNTVYLNQANFATTEGLAAGGFENYILTEDITLSNWTPPSNFTGKLYGNGRTITINSIVSSTNCGLLGVANNATIRDLHIHYQNISITGTGTTTFGGISAECSGSSSILNSIVSGSVNVDAAMNVGGIVGNMLGGTIKNSYSSVDINYSRTGGNSTNAFRIGGFVGYSTSSTLENCGSSNLIMVTHNSGIGEYKIGGFAGVLQNSVSKCFSTTSIEISITSSTTSDPRHDIGGFVGFATGGNYTVSESYATGSITVISSTPENSNYYVGGFVGYAQFGFENCYATGNISVDRITTGSGAGRITDIGGFAGGVFGTSSVTAIITLCFSTGSFTLMTTGLVTGGSVGGLAGYVNRQSIIANSLALGSYIAGIDQGSWTNIGRIGANVDDPPGGQSVYYYNNHAIESLKLYIFRGVSNYPEETEWWEEDMWPNLKNGGTISIVMLARNFYQNTLGFNSTIWDLGTPVTRNGWPTLRNVGGPQ